MPTGEERDRFPIFQERFNSLRGSMSQAEFSQKIGISRPTVGFYENGERLPDALILKKIAENCKVSIDWLLGLTDIRSGNSNDIAIEKRLGLEENSIKFLDELKARADEGWDRVPHLHFSDGMKLRALNYILSNIYAGSFLLDIACCIWSDFYKMGDEIYPDENGEPVCVIGDDAAWVVDRRTGGKYAFKPEQIIPSILVNIQNTIMSWRESEGTNDLYKGEDGDGEH